MTTKKIKEKIHRISVALWRDLLNKIQCICYDWNCRTAFKPLKIRLNQVINVRKFSRHFQLGNIVIFSNFSQMLYYFHRLTTKWFHKWKISLAGVRSGFLESVEWIRVKCSLNLWWVNSCKVWMSVINNEIKKVHLIIHRRRI
jgi:hypothetical protein